MFSNNYNNNSVSIIGLLGLMILFLAIFSLNDAKNQILWNNEKKLENQILWNGEMSDYFVIKKPGEIEAEFKNLGTEKVLKEFLTYKTPGPLYLSKGKYFKRSEKVAFALPSWLTQEDLDYYVTKYDKKGFTGPINYYRNIDRNWELTAPWTGAKIRVPVKFIVGDQDLTYNSPGAKEYINGGDFKRDVPLLDETVVLNGLGHFLHEENPDVINQHIHSFFHKFC